VLGIVTVVLFEAVTWPCVLLLTLSKAVKVPPNAGAEEAVFVSALLLTVSWVIVTVSVFDEVVDIGVVPAITSVLLLLITWLASVLSPLTLKEYCAGNEYVVFVLAVKWPCGETVLAVNAVKSSP